MKKILLINTNTEKYPYPVPPVGLCLLASFLENKYAVSIFDGIVNDVKELESHIKSYNPDFIGLSIRNVDNMDIEKTVFYVDSIFEDFVKPIKYVSKVPIIVGGSGFSIYPEELMELLGCDYGIIGEGETSFIELLDCLVYNRDHKHIPGVIDKGNDSSATHSIDNQSELILPFSKIHSRISFSPYQQRGVYPVQTKRGCYHNCIYCTYPLIEGKKFRLRRPDDVADEIEKTHYDSGCLAFEFVDSIFNDPPGFAEDICREIIKKKLNISLRTMGINPAHTSPELFSLMKKAGFNQIDSTPDSASPKMIVNLGKNFKYANLVETAKLVKEFELPTMWFFIFGGPGENEKTVKETFDFIDKYIYEYDMVHMTIGLRIYPGTPLHKLSIMEQKISAEEKLLYPRFYVSDEIGETKLRSILKEASILRSNCISASETTPNPKLLKEAFEMQIDLGLKEPVFRTLLRIRKRNMSRN